MTGTLRTKSTKPEINRLLPEDRPAHGWYRFVLSYPPHLVRDYLTKFGITSKHLVLDPFCGTGTTLVECKKRGVPSVGIEANPMAHLASSVKTDWSIQPKNLLRHVEEVGEAASRRINQDGLNDGDFPLFSDIKPGHSGDAPTLRSLPDEQLKLLLTDSISPIPLHKTLVLLDAIRAAGKGYERHELLALAKALVTSVGNLHFGPEVGLGSIKKDAAVVPSWFDEVRQMGEDLPALAGSAAVPARVHMHDARDLAAVLEPKCVDAVITSPPYPNEKDYTRTTRLESVLLGLITSKEELRRLKKSLVRSNTRGVYASDDDDALVSQHAEIQKIAHTIEARRLELGKTSGFERLYAKVTKLYFGGMKRHLETLKPFLAPGAQLAYVVGDQASYLRVMIRTGQLLADIAASLGYEVVGIDLFRTRLATATKEQLREEVVLLRWKGN